jgi:uncharacterized protein YcbK (DUF882 family)
LVRNSVLHSSHLTRRRTLLGAAALAATAILPNVALPATVRPIVRLRRLHMLNAATGETLDVSYRTDDHYNGSALRQVSYLMRDWRQEKAVLMDPRLIDQLAWLQLESRSSEPIYLVSGYRSPATNAMLAKTDPDVAHNSYHLHGQAADICLAGVPLEWLRDAAVRLGQGGVGYYPRHGFIHLDTGPTRTWTK